MLSEEVFTGHDMIARLSFGMRGHDVNICPRIDDWEVYMINENAENIHARVYKSAASKLAIVSFRGTQADSLQNWQVDGDVNMRNMHLDDNGGTANVHEGFLFAVERVLPAVKRWVNGHYHNSLGAVPYGWKLIFAGHSLGGALATMAATLAEVEGWHRKPDALVTFGAPRIGDANFSAWWSARGLCSRVLRLNVYNDLVHWTPFMAAPAWWGDLLGCVGKINSCFNKQTTAADPGLVQFSDRWSHICPESEVWLPGAMRGVNPKLEDFSPIGGIFAHFLGNGLFGYGYGVMNSGVVMHDEKCGISPQLFPSFACTVVEDLVGQSCSGLHMDANGHEAQLCRELCCNDDACQVWQFTSRGQCWRGKSDDCRRDIAGAEEVVASQRIH